MPEKKKKKSALRENIEAIIIAIIIALFIRTFVIQAFKIPSGSMLDTLQIGDQILVNKFIYGIGIPFTDGKKLFPVNSPEKGDIIVFKYPKDPSKDFIKRVVATGGDTIEMVRKKLYINGEPVPHEPYARYADSIKYPPNYRNDSFTRRDNIPKHTIPENKLFVMGDNRDSSSDSRFWGYVDLKAVEGKALIIYWSWNKAEFNVRWSRIGNLIE
jgi:signal peptidase I